MTNYNHVICDFTYKGEMGGIYRKIKKAIEKSGLTVVGEYVHYFNPIGVSIVFILAESHLSIHTWEEEKKINIDVFSCNKQGEYENKSLNCVNLFLKQFDVSHKNIQIIQRE